MFLELDQIARELDEIYLPLEQEGITGMRLSPQCDSSASVRALENAQETLGVKFPPAFSRLVCKFDLGEFEVCNVRFGAKGDYAGELVRLNGTDEYGGKWWPGEARPANLIVFAVGDPWIFLLDCADGAIYAWLLGDEELCGRRVAGDFERFFRALASIDIARLSKKAVPCAEEIAKFVQADDDKALEFWGETAEI
jgi:endonuclease/exonuclease/phosphatase